MHKTCLIKLIMILIKLIIAEYKDHIIYWDASNSIFEENPDELYVNEGDNLIFICSTNRTHVRNLYWTSDPRVKMKCNKTISINVIRLLDCFSKKSLNEFVLKVSRFPEITSLPTFDYNIPVHFIAHSFICQKNNIRLSFKLAKSSLNDKNNSLVSDVLMFPISESQLIDQNKSVSILNRTLQYHSKTKLVLESSVTYRNHTSITKEQTIVWKEYKLLLIPAIFAFLTLIGIKIILCSFWLPNSIVNKFIVYFKKCKYRRTSRSQSNQTCYKHETKKLFLDNDISSMSRIDSSKECISITSPYQCKCLIEPIVLHTNSCTKCTLEQIHQT
ncbi:unnamed protein product [Schistosoma rodhaini]|uniref:Integrin_alpha2 domain-containing protein n=1 Tax=Schistosoma rodhaini TaxID=6188 RepID=A0AA85F7A5_9TREM|nr:unnamed protein product [Schistosoma rodhaini]